MPPKRKPHKPFSAQTPALNAEEIDWLQLTPAKRMLESAKLWKFYLAMGGTLDSQPDTKSPFRF